MFLFFPLACSKYHVESIESIKTLSPPLVLNDDSFLLIKLNKTQKFYSKKKMDKGQIAELLKLNKISENKNLIKIETTSTFLSLILYEEGKKVALFENFVNFNPKYCEGILENVSLELFKREQNAGRAGILFPLYKIGCNNLEWVILDIKKRQFLSIDQKYLAGKPLKSPFYSECGYTCCEEIDDAIISPLFSVYATLSKKGNLSLYDLEKGEKIADKEDVISFCFHPDKEILYFGTGSGFYAYDFKIKESIKLNDYHPRLIRISRKGSFIFIIEAGGENIIHLFEIKENGRKIKKEILLSKEIKKSEDWVFVSDFELLSVINERDNSFILEKDLESKEEKKIDSPASSNIFFVNATIYPTIIAAQRKKEDYKERIFFYNIKQKKFEEIELLEK